jgi:hypothetical protein
MASSSVAMTAEGSSDSWEANKGNQVRLGNEFLLHISKTDSGLSTLWGQDWSAVPEDHAAHPDIYGHGATFLVYTYKKSTGKSLELGGVKTVWGGWVYQASQRLKNSTRQETKVQPALCSFARSVCTLSARCLLAVLVLFACTLWLPFDCAHMTSLTIDHDPQDFFSQDNYVMVAWYKGMKQKITRLLFERKLFMDEPMSNSANEIYLEHVRDITKAYSKVGTLQAAERKFAITTLWITGAIALPRPRPLALALSLSPSPSRPRPRALFSLPPHA